MGLTIKKSYNKKVVLSNIFLINDSNGGLSSMAGQNILEYFENNLSVYQRWRHHFHRYPELAFKENDTAEKIEKLLQKKILDGRFESG